MYGRILAVGLFLAGVWCVSASAQFKGGAGFGTPGFTSPAASGGASYNGPGDIVSGALGWWGLRCYNNAYSGNVADIVDSGTGNTTGTRLQCASGVVSALVSGSACTFVTGNACSPLATTCAVACLVPTLYDQSGNSLTMVSAGGGGAPTSAPKIILNNLGTLPSVQCIVSSGHWMRNAGITQAQGLQISYVSNRNNNTTTLQRGVFASNGVSIYVGYSSSLATAEINAGSSADLGATDNAFHAYQAGFNGASSNLMIDGTANTGLSVGTAGLSGTMSICGNTFAANFDGYFQEVGIWAGLFSGPNETAMNNNQRAYWGF